jgi:hypothetical protein
MISKHTNTYTALICKYTPFPNRQNKRHKKWSYLTSIMKNSKIFALEYNTSSTEPNNELDHYVNTLQRHNEDFDPEINDMFLNNLDPTFYAMQMQNPDVLTHAQMKQQVDANKFIEAQRPEIKGLMDINTFESIPKINLPPRTRYLDLIWTYRRKRRPDGSLNKYKAHLCVNGSRQIQGIDYTESFAPVVQWSTIRMVNTLTAMHNLKGKQIDFTQAFPQAKLKEDIYLRFPASFEHKNKLKRNLYGLVQVSRNWFLKLSASMKDSDLNNKNLNAYFSEKT